MKSATKQTKKASANTSATSAKKVAPVKKVDSTVSEVKKINLSTFTEMLATKDVEKTQKDRQHLYLYPETFTAADLNGQKGKKHRQALRNKLQRFSNNVFVYAKTNEIEKLQSEIELFNLFYKENFRLQDYSVKSLTASEKNEKDLTDMLSIIKHVMSA